MAGYGQGYEVTERWRDVDRSRTPNISREDAVDFWPNCCRLMDELGLHPEMVERVVLTDGEGVTVVIGAETFRRLWADRHA